MKQVLIALDQLINTFLGGQADETLSARAWRTRGRNSWWKVIDAVFFFDPQHCKTSYESEINRRQLPKEYRDACK